MHQVRRHSLPPPWHYVIVQINSRDLAVGGMTVEEGDKFAEFVCAATFDTDSDTNIEHHND